MAKIKQMSEEEFIKLKGQRCPVCFSDEVNYCGDDQSECLNCGRNWDVQTEITGYALLDQV